MEKIVNKTSNEVFLYNDLNEIYNNIEEFIDSLKKDSKEKTVFEIKHLKILILIKILKNVRSVKLTFENLLCEKDIENYEAFICALSFNDSVEELSLGNYLWDNEEDFSFYNNFEHLFRYNKILKKIILEGNIPKENDLALIKSSILNNRRLEELVIDCSGYIKCPGLKKAFDDFQKTVNIKKLSIKISMYTDCFNERIHLSSEMFFENLILKKLIIYRNRVDMFVCNMYETLCENLKIEDLKFRFELIPHDIFKKIMNNLMNNTNLLQLDISHNNLTDDCIKELSEYLKVNKKLKVLNLEKNNIGDEGLKILSEILLQNNEIKELDISWNNYTDEGIKHFKKFILKSNSIEKIFLSKEGLSEEGIKEIKEAFKENMNVKKIMMGIVNMTR